MTEDIIIHPIGVVHSPYKIIEEIPKSYRESGDTEAIMEIDPKYAEAMNDMHVDEEYMILFYFHESEGYDLTVPYRGEGPMMGLFSTHAPRRPNPIGVSIIKIVKIEENMIYFKGVDMLDKTPILDIKSA